MSSEEVIMSVLGGLMLIIGYFVKIVHSDVRRNTLEAGRNKGKIEQLEIQLENEKEMRQMELKNQQESTQKSIENMAKGILELSKDVKMLINNKLNE